MEHSPLRLTLLGATGSIGTQTLSVLRAHPDKLCLESFAIDSNIDKAIAIAQEFLPKQVAIANETLRTSAKLADFPKDCKVLFGQEAVDALCEDDVVDIVVNAIVGVAGIGAAYTALTAHKLLAYANKESIVVGGDILMPMAEPGQIRPVDSEHSAIFQCLEGERDNAISALWLTCSGGPFFGRSRAELAHVSAQDALKHPTWKMGAKITIDSATLMNKGLEVLEAKQLFGIDIDNILVLVQPQSQIHSMVAFADGSVKAQLGPSDMRIAIQYALSYPERWESPVTPLDFRELGALSFGSADTSAFGCLALAQEAGRRGGTAPCVLNAANEVANAAFRREEISFLDIEKTVAHVLEKHVAEPVLSLEQLHVIDRSARTYAQEFIAGGL